MPPDVQIAYDPRNVKECTGGPTIRVERPGHIDAAIYYPATEESVDVHRSIPSLLQTGPTWPVILYAHARRRFITCPQEVPSPMAPALSDFTQDFRRVDRMLSHVASHGYVVAAPDLGWLIHAIESAEAVEGFASPRAAILVALHNALEANQGTWFDGQLNFRKLALFGHSTGAAGCLIARRNLPMVGLLGLIAPAILAAEDILALAEEAPTTIVIAATRDTMQGANPDEVFARLRQRKVLVRMEGANHLGFTELCSVDNQVCMDTDPPGAVSRIVQQEVAAAYLVAAARLFLDGASSMKPYLDGTADTGAANIGPPVTVTWQ
jgi:hypothetical protein